MKVPLKSSMSSIDLSIVLPAYNEGTSIKEVVTRFVTVLRQKGVCFEVVVVDNGSTDATASIVAGLQQRMPEVCVVTIPLNEGYGNGIIHGLKSSKGAVLGWCDADGQVDPEDVVGVYEHMRDTKAVFAKGCRKGRFDGMFRRIESAVFNGSFRLFFDVSVHDVNGKPKFMERALYERLELSSKDWFIDAECVIKARAAGINIHDVVIRSIIRRAGRSKVRISSALEFCKNIARYKMLGY